MGLGCGAGVDVLALGVPFGTTLLVLGVREFWEDGVGASAPCVCAAERGAKVLLPVLELVLPPPTPGCGNPVITLDKRRKIPITAAILPITRTVRRSVDKGLPLPREIGTTFAAGCTVCTGRTVGSCTGVMPAGSTNERGTST